MSDSEYTRTIDGQELPAAGTWMIDPMHTTAEFIARHLMVSKVRGSIQDVNGTILVAEDPGDSQVTVVLQAQSIETGAPDRDGHLRGEDFLNVEKHPTIEFKSRSVERSGAAWRLNGDLTIRDVTQPVSLDFEFLGVIKDPWGNAKAAFSAFTEIDREDWGLTWNVPLEAGGVLIGKKVRIEIDVQAAPAAEG